MLLFPKCWSWKGFPQINKSENLSLYLKDSSLQISRFIPTLILEEYKQESPRQQHLFTEFCSALIEKNKIFLQCFCVILGHTNLRNQKILFCWILSRKDPKFSKDEVFKSFLKKFITTFCLEIALMKALMVFQFLNQTPYQVSRLRTKCCHQAKLIH